MVMNEKISRLMDGECDEAELEGLCATLKRPEAFATWSCYHAIGDVLRGQHAAQRGFSSRFAARIAQEPTVLAPRPRLNSRTASWALAAAATVAAVSVVSWTAFSVVDDIPAVLAKARQSGAVRATQLRLANVPADYLLAHQEYSPATAIQGVGPYLRAVAVPGGEPHP
jgi:sigma-E factor negative regulatory protein RseA